MPCPFFSIKVKSPLFLWRTKAFEIHSETPWMPDGYLVSVNLAQKGVLKKWLQEEREKLLKPYWMVLEYEPHPSDPMPHAVLSRSFIKDHFLFEAQILKEHGINQAILSLDQDGLLQKMLSPRFNPRPINERADFAFGIYEMLSEILQTGVALTLEELCPGGLDVTDGLWLKDNLLKKGLSTLIVSSGTLDFPIFKYPKQTWSKSEEQVAQWPTVEPWLSCATWIDSIPGLSLLAQGPLNNLSVAKDLALALGLTGIVGESGGTQSMKD